MLRRRGPERAQDFKIHAGAPELCVVHKHEAESCTEATAHPLHPPWKVVAGSKY